MRTEIRQHADEIRRQGIAYERMFSRQQRNENTIGDVQHKCKQISRSICDLGSESMAKIGKNPSKSRISDMRSTTSFYENGLFREETTKKLKFHCKTLCDYLLLRL